VNNKRIKFRPHHFLCALGFQGKGYSPEFVENFGEIAAQLNNNANISIEVVGHTDDVCQPCPHRRNLNCATQTKIDKLDQAHAVALNIKAGDVLTWRAVKKLIAQNISVEKFQKICAPCEWQKLGICETALQNLLTAKQQNV
jgi:uncharacterized protein